MPLIEQAKIREQMQEGTCTVTLIRIGDQIYFVEETDREAIQAEISSQNMPVADLPGFLRSGAMDIRIVVAISREVINTSIETYFAVSDKPVDSSQLTDRHSLILCAHPQFQENTPESSLEPTLELVSQLFPDFSVSVHNREQQLTVSEEI